MAIAELKLLGPFEARDERGRPVHLPSRKVRALLAFLALHPERRFHRGYLATLLWGEDNPDNARHSLRQALTILRPECPSLEVNTQFVRMNGGSIAVDVALIESAASSQRLGELERAVAASEGELLEGHEHDTELFARWLYPERERLHALSRTVSEALIRLLPAPAQHERGLELARRLIDDDPYDESAHRLYLSLLVNAGQQRAALKHYGDLCDFLRRELGTDPEDETSAIVRDIAHGGGKAKSRSLLEDLRQELGKRSSRSEGPRWRAVVLGPSGAPLPVPGEATRRRASDPMTRAMREALSQGLHGGAVTLAPAGGDVCVLIPLRNRDGALDGALALLTEAPHVPPAGRARHHAILGKNR